MAQPSDDLATGYLLWRVTTKWRAAVDRAVAPLGLTHAQYTVLASLYGLSRTGTQPSQRELADFAGLEPIFVSKLARALEQGGLVVREDHPADPRAVRLSLTDRGTDVVVRALGVVHGLVAELTGPIGGPAGPRNRELVRTLRALLRVPPSPGGTDQNGSAPMSQPTAPALTGQDIGEAEGALRALLDEILAGTGTTSTEYIVLRVLALRGPWDQPAALHDFLAGQRQLRLDPPDVADLLRRLAARGLVHGVARDGAGPAELTSSGAALHDSLTARIGATTSRLYGDFAPEELATVHRVLAELVERANKLRGELGTNR